MARTLIDTNLLVYAYSDDAKAEVARRAIERGYVLSVQALNEFTRVARSKLRFDWRQIETALSDIRSTAIEIQSVDIAVHEAGMRVAERYRLSVFDSMMVGAGLISNCEIMLSEDLQHDQVIEGHLRIVNPFLD